MFARIGMDGHSRQCDFSTFLFLEFWAIPIESLQQAKGEEDEKKKMRRRKMNLEES